MSACLSVCLSMHAIYSCRERELQIQTETTKEGEKGQRDSRSSDPQPPREETTETARAATTCELIAASMIEQAKSFMAEVRYFCFDMVTSLRREAWMARARASCILRY